MAVLLVVEDDIVTNEAIVNIWNLQGIRPFLPLTESKDLQWRKVIRWTW